MKKFFRSLLVVGIFAVAAPAFATGSFDCGYSAEEIQRFFLAYFDPNGEYYIVRRDDDYLIMDREISPSSVRYLMPKIRLPKRDPKDPKEPERWDYAPVHRAICRITLTFRFTTQNTMRTTLREDRIANPDAWDQVIVNEDWSDFYITRHYLRAILDGGTGSGVVAGFRGSHLYVNDVLEGSSADRAGVRAGDRIMHINKMNGDDVTLMQFAQKYEWSDLIGKPFTLDLASSDGSRREVSLTCDYIPAQVERLKRFFGTDDILPGRTAEQVYAVYEHYVPPVTPEQRRQQQLIAAMPIEFDDAGVITLRR